MAEGFKREISGIGDNYWLALCDLQRLLRAIIFMKPRALVSLIAAVFAVFIALSPSRASAYSLLLNAPSGWNGLAMGGSVVTGFRESGGPGLLLSTNAVLFPLINPDGPADVPGFSFTNWGAWTNFPTSGLAKDMAGAILDISWTTGTTEPDSFDSFDVRIRATNSAEGAMVDFGAGAVQADGVVRVNFFLQSPGPLFVEGGTAGLELPAMQSLTAPAPNIESLIAVATIARYGESPTTTYTRLPGDDALVIPLELSGSQEFRYELSYELITPYGTDPGVDYSFSGGAATTVPEPSTYALLAMSAAGALWLARRRPVGGRCVNFSSARD